MSKKHDEETTCPLCEFMTWTRNSETTVHLRNARREILLAVKSAIEAGLERLDQEETPAPASRRKAKKVKID
ncbi:MAG: hypothetical protein KKB20_05225 [Proteobacteria bacterium]|nr:hypothetical protein [Pseudomonadota bacterium]